MKATLVLLSLLMVFSISALTNSPKIAASTYQTSYQTQVSCDRTGQIREEIIPIIDVPVPNRHKITDTTYTIKGHHRIIFVSPFAVDLKVNHK
jgi:hypothetical protein